MKGPLKVSKHLHWFPKYLTFCVLGSYFWSKNQPSLAQSEPMIADFHWFQEVLKTQNVEYFRNQRRYFDKTYDMMVKFWSLHGHGTKKYGCLAHFTQGNTAFKHGPLKHVTKTPTKKSKFVKNSFFMFSYKARSFKKICNIFLSIVSINLINFLGTYQSISFQVSLYNP